MDSLFFRHVKIKINCILLNICIYFDKLVSANEILLNRVLYITSAKEFKVVFERYIGVLFPFSEYRNIFTCRLCANRRNPARNCFSRPRENVPLSHLSSCRFAARKIRRFLVLPLAIPCRRRCPLSVQAA